MGVFDKVEFNCTKCGAVCAFQSKAGECDLTSHTLAAVPLEIAADLEYEQVTCEVCKTSYSFEFCNPMATVRCVVVPVENEVKK